MDLSEFDSIFTIAPINQQELETELPNETIGTIGTEQTRLSSFRETLSIHLNQVSDLMFAFS
jgi:hypothetical protein